MWRLGLQPLLQPVIIISWFAFGEKWNKIVQSLQNYNKNKFLLDARLY